VKNQLIDLFGDNFAHIESLPIDFRENTVLFKFVCSKTLLSNENIDRWNNSINLYHLNLFWIELMQRLTLSSTAENSLFVIAQKVFQQELNDKQIPHFVVPIFKTIRLVQNEILKCVLHESVPNKQVVTIRNQLLWCFQLIECCHQSNSSLNWDQFVAECFFPLWFMFNEQIVPLLGSLSQLSALIGQVNSFLKMDSSTFDSNKFELVKQLTDNYFRFKTSHDIDLFNHRERNSFAVDQCALHLLRRHEILRRVRFAIKME